MYFLLPPQPNSTSIAKQNSQARKHFKKRSTAKANMSHTRMLASKKATPDSPDIMTVDEAASILTHMNLADRLLNPTNRLEICGKPSLSSNDHTQPIEEKLSPQNLHRIENAWKLGNQGLHPNRPRLLPKYRAPSAKYKPLARDFFAMNMDVDTTASAKGKAPGQIPKNDHMDAESTTQTPNQANSRARKTVSHASSNAGAGSINQNQAEAARVDEAPNYRWRLCTCCGVPGHPIASCPMVPCRSCHTVGHAPRNCPHVPCKYCNSIGQHAVKDCPVFHAKRNEHLRTATARWRKNRIVANSAAKCKPIQLENSLPKTLANNEAAHNNSINLNGKRSLAKETSMQSPICNQPSHQTRNRNRPNLPCGYCHSMGHLPKNCPVAETDKDERERASSTLQREMWGQVGSGK